MKMDEFYKQNKFKELLPDELKPMMLIDGKLADQGLNSEYERGFVDSWNKLIHHVL
jgi:hypothetical protein